MGGSLERARIGLCLIALGALLPAGSVRSDCILDVYQNPVAPFSGLYTIYPNWIQAPVGAFTIYEGDDTTYSWCPTSSITGLTMFNYGTATGGATGDITGAYFNINCGSKTNSGIVAMTYAGVWTVGLDSYPAWTWDGPFLIPGDPCSNLGFNCLCNVNLFVYVDVHPCAIDGRTVSIGPGFNDDLNPGWPGGVYDDCGCAGPWGPVQDTTEKTIHYVMKNADKDTIAPGDTINYTIYYGRPGIAALTGITIMDTPPPYTHLIFGSSVPPPDPGFDPDPGPPMRLRWTIPPPLPVGGGPTGEITFQLTVDWGNGEGFEPGSGDAGAPEGSWLRNSATGAFGTTCGTKAVTTAPTATVVRRFLFWKTANNDILFSPSYGQPPDEITYDIFMKNVSSSRTWWKVNIWDTVPAELDVWGTGFGMDDPCVGWSMTPSGCAQAAAGKLLVGSQTRLTWRLDMPPGMTISIRWKAQVRPTDTAGSTALSRVSIMADGMTGIVGGTGPSGQIKVFTHQVPIVLPTMYISYLALGAGLASYFQCCNDVVPFSTQTYWLCFFPLNMKTNFNLYEQTHSNDAYVNGGGLSPSISLYAGACSGGLGWFAGCGPERAPAFYLPPAYNGCPAPVPMHDLYKLVSNAPLLWELLSGDSHNGCEVSTYVGATSLTYNGYASYTYARTCVSDTNRDGLYIVNTSTSTTTTIHTFAWNAAVLNWDYVATSDVDIESMWFFYPPLQNAYRIISSDSTFILFKALPLSGNPNTASNAPNRENGFLVNSGTPAHFYAFAEKDVARGGTIIVQNVGGALATYDIFKYLSNNPTIPQISTKHQSPNLVGNSGIWSLRRANDTVGIGTAHPYQLNYDTGAADQRDFYRIDLKSGGPIQVFCGYRLIDAFGGGSVIHSSSGTPAGNSYWMPNVEFGHSGKICAAPFYSVSFLDFFMPKTGTKVQATNNVGYSASYTTTGPDQCVTFMEFTEPTPPAVHSLHVVSTGGSVAVAQWQICSLHQKIFTAPFVAQGVHYSIIMPSVVFSGQPFWITVIVVQTAGGTEVDYCGTTSFTSTDATSKIEGTAMDTYNYTWDSNDAGATCKGAGCTGGCDNGVKLFFNVTMNRLGLQTIVAVDTSDGSVSGVAAVQVVGADVRLAKEPKLVLAASADTVRFKVCWSNFSSASGFGVTITDAIPMGTSFLPEGGTAAFNCGSTDGVAVNVAYSTATTAAMPAAASFTSANPVAGTRWLRWTVPMAGVQTTGCACYRVQIN